MNKKIGFIVEDLNNGLSKEEILKKYNIKKSSLQVYLSIAKKEGMEIKPREKAKPKYMQVVEDWNNGLSEEEILEKYNIINKNLQAYLSQARKRGIEVKIREKAKPKYMLVVEDWNNGLPKEEILEKYNIINKNLQTYLSQARKRGIEVKTREKAKPKYMLVVEDWNNGLPEDEIFEKYNIVKINLQTYLSKARKIGIGIRVREKAKPKYMLVVEDWNNGLPEEEILEKYNLKNSTLQNYLRQARKRGIEVKAEVKVKAKPKYMLVVEDWNNGLPEEEILEKYNLKNSTLQTYLSQTRKRGIEVKTREKAKPKYMLVVEDWNNGLSKEEIMKKYQISSLAFSLLVRRAKKHRILVREKAKPKYMQVVDDWNNGLLEEEILQKYNIKRRTLQGYLSRVKKEGKEVKARKKTNLKYMQVVDDWNNGLSEKEILQKYNIKKTTFIIYLSRARKEKIEVKAKEKANHKNIKVVEDKNNGLQKNKSKVPDNKKSTRDMIKESLKVYLPRQVAKKLKISNKAVFDVLDSLTPEEEKEVNKAFIRNRPYVFSRVKKLKKEGKSVLEALKCIDREIPLYFLSQLEEVYYILGLYANIEKSINKRIYIDESTSDKDKNYLHNLKETMHLEVISMKIRKQWKEAKEKGKTISFERLCKEYNVRTSFLIDLLGREERDY